MQFVIHPNYTINVQIHPIQNVNSGGPGRKKALPDAEGLFCELYIAYYRFQSAIFIVPFLARFTCILNTRSSSCGS